MGIVRFALRFPHTFYVVAAFILFIGVTAIRTMPMDIFPEINIPVVTVIWEYDGLATPEMEQRVTIYSQYSISANVSGIKDMEAQTLNGLSVVKIYFQPDVSIDLAIAQIISASNSIRALMPDRNSAAGRGAVQRLERAGAAVEPHIRHPRPDAALQLWALYAAPAVGAGAGRHLPDAGRRQAAPDHGRHRPQEAAGQGPYAHGRRQCGQRPEPDTAVGLGQDRRPSIHHPHQLDGAAASRP